MHRSKKPLFDNLVGGGEHRGWNFEPKQFGSLEVITVLYLVGAIDQISCCSSEVLYAFRVLNMPSPQPRDAQ